MPFGSGYAEMVMLLGLARRTANKSRKYHYFTVAPRGGVREEHSAARQHQRIHGAPVVVVAEHLVRSGEGVAARGRIPIAAGVQYTQRAAAEACGAVDELGHEEVNLLAVSRRGHGRAGAREVGTPNSRVGKPSPAK